MKIILKVCFSFLFFLISTLSFAQRPALVQADLAFDKGDYYDAATLYKKAFSKEKNKVKRAEIIFKVAESYRLTNDYKNQVVWYQKAIKANYKDPIAILRYADALKMDGKYDEAIVQYTIYEFQESRLYRSACRPRTRVFRAGAEMERQTSSL
jgi:peptidoglycan-associated lipoprotein